MATGIFCGIAKDFSEAARGAMHVSTLERQGEQMAPHE
jgi:hypothetical protein